MKRGEVWWVEFDPSVGSELRKTMADQIMAADKKRLKGTLGALSKEGILQVEDSIRVHLGLPR